MNDLATKSNIQWGNMIETSKNPSLLHEIQERVRFVNRQWWCQLVVKGKGTPANDGFFDHYPRFFETSRTAAKPDRLNQRYRALIEANSEMIARRRVLDLASHDGRWSLAANKAGAAHVLGIEARTRLIEAAQSNMREYGVPENQVDFTQGDVLTELDRLEPGQFDTVFCFGFLYHIIDHMPLLRKIARLKPRHLIIDTAVSVRPANIIEIRDEEIENESNGAVGEPGRPARTVSGRPTKPALELMLQAAGFRPLRYYDWLHAGIERWDDVADYYLGTRVSLTSEAA
jgi:2-polyprenyl-3-methyl-5-hydroxy-6-metoxy-1,4-benzoquinol methylase